VPTSHYRADIDGLRAIAVLSVVGYHAFPRAVHGGFTGVDVFFVISGFLISGLILEDLRRGRFTFHRFYARRFRRIFPALVLVLAACLLYGALALAPDAFRELGKQALAAAFFSSNLVLQTQSGYFNQSETTNPLLHLWSLGVEEQFYIAWPIILVMAYSRARWVLYVCTSLGLLSFATNIVLTHLRPEAAFYLPMPRFWELLLGSLLAYAARSHAATGAAAGPPPLRAAEEWRAGLGLALVLAGFFWIETTRAFPGWWVLLPTVGTALVISAPQAWINRTLLSVRPLVFIGLISYPLYLWHWVLLTFARIANFDDDLPRSWRLAAVLVSGVLAWLTYRWVEKPIRFSGHRDVLPRALIASMVVCALAGGVIYATDGFAFRYPQEIRLLAAYDHEHEVTYYENLLRDGTCFLGPADSLVNVASQCVDKPDGSSKLVVLWGDSHAASLYLGLRAAQQQIGFRIAQFTASACPPLIGRPSDGRPNCVEFNDLVLAQLRALRPDVVILEAHWALYSPVSGWPSSIGSALRRTVQTVQQAGIPKIIVMGSLPAWKIYQPRVAFEIWRHQHALKDRSKDLLDSTAFEVDSLVHNAVAGTAAIFLSPIATLCDEAGCLISTDPRTPTPVAFDNDHLSLAGSRWVVNRAITPVLRGSGART
jgi:peptidoglycan/LPS O-acetylase OafA/YrhL